MTIRDARPADGTSIATIWNPIVRDTTITFTTEEKTASGVAGLIAATQAAGDAFLVAELPGGSIEGFAFLSRFRPGPGYAHVREHSIYLAEGVRGKGLGRALYAVLEARARAVGVALLVAGVSGENSTGLAFHRALGFTETGHLPGLGRKFARPLDLVLMQKTL